MANDYRAEDLSCANLKEALKAAKSCFSGAKELAFLNSHWERVVSGKVEYFCDEDRAELKLLEHFVFRIGPQIAGFGGLYRHNDKPQMDWLNWLGVVPEFRSRGLGAEIVCYLSGIAKQRGSKFLVAYTSASDDNSGTRKFYDRMGFSKSRTYQFRSEAVQLYQLDLS